MFKRTIQAPQSVGPLSKLKDKRRQSSWLRVVVVALLALAGALPLAPVFATVPGMPGTPQAGTVIFAEDWENGSGVTELETYVGDAPINARYNADPYWLLKERCNGFLLSYSDPLPVVGDYCNGGQWQGVQSMAYALGLLAGGDPATNHAIATLSAGGCTTTTPFCGDGPITQTKVFETVGQPVTLSTANRFIAFTVNLAATACTFGNHPSLRFYLRDSTGTEIPVSTSAIDPCAGGQVIPAGTNPPGFFFDIHYDTYFSTASFLLSGTSLGIVLRDDALSSAGNDFAIDTIRALDVTPQLDKSFSPATMPVGGVSTLTFTITNTTELLPKNGWSFTDNLPAGLVVASPNAATTTCSAGVVTAPAGGTAITVSGNLNAGQASCTVSVAVTSSTAATYNNCPTTNVTNFIGMNPPACAAVTFVALPLTLTKTWTNAIAGNAVSLTISGTGVSGATAGSSTAPSTTTPATATATSGSTVTLAEAFTVGAAGDYTTTLACTKTSDGSVVAVTGSGQSRTLTMPGDSGVSCTYNNTLNVAPVTLTKVWVDSVTGHSVSLAISGTKVVNAVNGSSAAPSTTTPATAQAVVGSTVNLAETFTTGGAAGYTTTTTCVRSNNGNPVTMTNNSFTMIGPGVNCTFTNTGRRGSIVIVKDAVPNDAQDFAFTSTTTTSTPLGGFSLDDDGDGTLSNTRTFTNLLSGTYAVTEGVLPAGWSLTGLNCTDPNGGTTTSGATASIQLSAGEAVTCTYINTRALSNLSITKTNTPGTNGEVDQSGDTVTRGTSTTYTIVVTNNGPDAVTGAVVRDPTQTGLTCNDPVPCTGSACPSATVPLSSLQGTGGVVLGTLASGGTVTFTLSCTVQ